MNQETINKDLNKNGNCSLKTKNSNVSKVVYIIKLLINT